jgi:hypothetical protein
MEQAILNIPPNVADALRNTGDIPLDRRLLELAAIEAHREGLLTEWEVIEMLGFEDREELYEFFKRYDVRAEHIDLKKSSETLDSLLTRHHR